ncbi:MAG TPA: mechanosensitive ion channel protein MscS, partial [Gammaproteobacteria bacterium]|nr:mechanosensitive ion channel protein MscS [Gammaproteobacteria bacterium]
MNEFLQNLTPLETVGILFAVAFIAHIVLGVALRKIISHAGKTKIQWD